MIVDVDAQLRRGVVEYCTLGLLEQREMYGWQLAAELSESGMVASIGTLYPLLARLRRQELIEEFHQQSGAGPTRKYYRLTAEGTRQLNQFRAQWGPFTQAVDRLTGRKES